MRILVTTSSFLDNPGKHHDLLNESGYEIITEKGPLSKERLETIIADFDGVICGDDHFTEEVLEKGLSGKLKVISKYGVGLDKVDLIAAKKFEIPVFNTPGINQVTVAEHTIALLLSYLKNIHLSFNITSKGGWKRLTGNDLSGMRAGILGLGKVGTEVAKRLAAFDVELRAFDKQYCKDFLKEYAIQPAGSIGELVSDIDILCLHVPLNQETKNLINHNVFNKISRPIIIVNTSRASVLNQKALVDALKSRKIRAYLADVMEIEPMPTDHPLLQFKNVLITPHTGSRTVENVEKQGIMAVKNLTDYLMDKHTSKPN